ncbi:hypothetical protein BKA93DRAFT_726060 [Sparassis latifolia]
MPNPYTPLAFLQPAMANDFEGSRYLYVATLSAFTLDWMMAWPDEYRIIVKAPIRLSNIIYCISRIFAFTYILTNTIFQIASVGSCQALQVALASCFTVGVPATSALFYLRICAVFRNSRPIIIIFGLLWLSILATCLTIPFAIGGTHIGTTDRGINSKVKPFSSSAIITNTVNDTFVFLAISFRLVSFSMQGNTIGDRFRSFVRGDGLPKFSKLLLQGGQMYYFATVALNILTMAMILSPSMSPVFRAMFSIPNVALENAMATRVFRAVHLGLISDADTSPHSSGPSRGLAFMNHGSGSGAHASRGSGCDVYPLETRVFDHHVTLGNHIQITKTMETHHDVDDLPAKRESLTDVESGLGQV